MHRIVFTGAQGTGKTTVLKDLETRGMRVITEVVRQLSKNGVKINREGDESGQNKIFKKYKDLLSEFNPAGYVSDRGLIDVMSYTLQLVEEGKVSREFADKQLKQLKKFVKETPDIVYCYFPIEFPAENDGVRDVNEDYRATIDNNIRGLLQELGVNYIVVSGSVEERTNKVLRLYNWMDEGYKLFSE